MTREEAIQNVKWMIQVAKTTPGVARKVWETLKIALDELERDTQPRELTPAELEGMDGEPVWVEREDGYRAFSAWALVSSPKGGVPRVAYADGGSNTVRSILALGGRILTRKPEEEKA